MSVMTSVMSSAGHGGAHPPSHTSHASTGSGGAGTSADHQHIPGETEHEFINKALGRIGTHAGVFGMLVVHPATGRILHKTGFNNSTELCEKWNDSIMSFVDVAASTVRTLDHTDDITFLRMQWRQKHIIVCPDPHREYIILVVQDQMSVSPPEGAGHLVVDEKATK